MKLQKNSSSLINPKQKKSMKKTQPIRHKRFTKLQYQYAFDVMMEIFNYEAHKLPDKFLRKVDTVANYLGDKAEGRKPDFI